MWSKREIVQKAFSELALAGYTFDLAPEEMDDALTTLDTIMAEWAAMDINVSYQFGLTPDDTDLDQDSGLPLIAVGAAYRRLAIDIAGGKGKTVPPTLHRAASRAYRALLVTVAKDQVREQPSRVLGVGAGDKNRWGRTFTATPDTSPLSDGFGT